MNSVLCPKCSAVMILRQRKSDRKSFYGCSRFPSCDGLRQMDDVRNTPRPEPKIFVPSKYQQAIFDWVRGNGKALVVEALAGSGKTTTGVQMLEIIPKNLDVVFVAFNKHIADELRNRVPGNVKVCTYHSLGFTALRNTFPQIRVDEDKVDHVIQMFLDKWSNRALYPAIKSLVSLVKANLTGTTPDELSLLADRYGIELNGDSAVIFQTVPLVVARCLEMTSQIDYDDMCWLPIALNLRVKQYDFIFIDEAQDTNKNQVALALASVKDDGRVVAVGDRYQSIYGFRGADVNAIPSLIENLQADTLPLSITYRCPKSHVEYVNNLFPNIPLECSETAISGEILQVAEYQFSSMVVPGDMVLCRTNAPLVMPAFELIRKGVKAVIRGRDIGSNLTNLIRKMKCSDLTELIVKLEAYRVLEVGKLLAREKNSQAQSLNDKVETINALSDGITSISELEDRIDTIFSDDVVGVVFSSVHKAKGLEAKRVFILHPELMPHKMAKRDWEQAQEKNIQYVAYTRSLESLIFVS